MVRKNDNANTTPIAIRSILLPMIISLMVFRENAEAFTVRDPVVDTNRNRIIRNKNHYYHDNAHINNNKNTWHRKIQQQQQHYRNNNERSSLLTMQHSISGYSDATNSMISSVLLSISDGGGADSATAAVMDATAVVNNSNGAVLDTGIFIIGLIPFVWATYEFWRRIAVGASFGTGSDSIVIIGEDDAPESSRGKRVLGKGALFTAYVLFGISAVVVGVVLFSVLTSPSDPFINTATEEATVTTQQQQTVVVTTPTTTTTNNNNKNMLE